MLRVEETQNSRIGSNRQKIMTPHHKDRHDIEYLLDKIEMSVGQPAGAHPAELHLIKTWYTLGIDKQFADLVPMLKAHIDFIEAEHGNNARGYNHTSLCGIHGDTARLSLRLREMKRCERIRLDDSLPEHGEWFFDQRWSFNRGTAPDYGITFETLSHSAEGRNPIVYRHAEFWMHQQTANIPDSFIAAMPGRKFGELVDSMGQQEQFVGKHLDDWTVADVFNDQSINMFMLKLSHPDCPKD